MVLLSSTSCNTQSIDLFNTLSIEIPSSMEATETGEYLYGNAEKNVVMAFLMTEKLRLGETLPKLSFDYQIPEYTIVLRDERMTVAGYDVRIVSTEEKEMVDLSAYVKVHEELLWANLTGPKEHEEYMNGILRSVLESIREI
jgi:hypothetical protein